MNQGFDFLLISGRNFEIHKFYFRGRYDIKMYPTFVQLHGKTFDYKIPHQSVLRLFLLPHKDGRQIFFLVSDFP